MRGTGWALAGLAAAGFCASSAKAATFEDRVLSKINQARAAPRAYAQELRRDEARDERYGYARAAYVDDDATDEAIDFLMRQRPLPPLRADGRIAAAAAEHVRRQGPRGDVGHGAPGSLGARLHGHGVWAGISGESISYGQATPSEVVRQLVVDSGVPNRGHRMDIFARSYQAAGVACGRHAAWGSMCVIDFAGEIVRR
jgi:uncharacterized protein YkwD